nr:putative ribonuclease H-like domain-containing protein [Tanacetum cinerariifolium]
MNYQPVTAGNQTNSGAGFQDKFDTEKAKEEVDQQYVLFPVWSSGSTHPQDNDKDAAFNGKEHDFDTKKPKSIVILSLSSSAQTKKQDDKTKIEDKGKSHVESFTECIDLNAEFEDCSANSSNEVNAAGFIVPTVRQKSLNNTNTFSAAGPYNTAVIPTYGKYSFIDASQLPNDQDMPELEDITYFNDEDVGGAEVDFNNLESSIPVYQMDIKSEFLYGTVEEEVYVCQLPGFEDPNHPDKVYKVVKALYGLHQAPRACQDKYVAKILSKFGLTEGKSASTPIDTEKPLLKDPDGEDVDVHTYSYIKYALTVNLNIYVSCIKQFRNTVVVNQTNDVTRLQALVDKKKVMITKATIIDALRLDDAEGIACLSNEEIFAELARMGYEKPSTKLTFYKAFFSSQWKFLIHTILQSMSAKHTSWNEFSSAMASAVICLSIGKGFSRAETPLFEGMLVAGVIEEEGDAEEHVDVAEDNVAQGDDTAIIGDAIQDQSILSPTPPTLPPQQPQDLPSTSQGRMIDDLDSDAGVALMDDKEEEKKAKEAKFAGDDQEDEPAKMQEVVDVVTTAKLIIEVVIAASESVTAASITIFAAEPQVLAATITAVLSKDISKGIMVEEPKPLKKKQQVEIDEEMLLHSDWTTLRLSYDDIRPIFEAKFNSNIAFLLKTKEQLDEEKNRAIQSINETSAQKAAKRSKLNEEVKDLKRHLEIVPDEDDDVYTEATPLARKVPVVDYEIIHLNNKPHYKIIRADGTHQLWTSLILKESKDSSWSSEVEWRYLLLRFTLDQVLNAVRLRVEEHNEMSLELLRIKQYFLMTDYSLWEVILNGDSFVPTQVVEGVLQPVVPTTAEQRLAIKNELKACVKQSSSTSLASQNLDFVSSSHTDSTTDSVSATASVSTIYAKLPASTLPNVDSLSNVIDVDDLEEMDLRWQMAMLTIRARRECRSSKDLRRCGAAERQRRISYQAEEEPANFALMAFSSSSSSDNELSPTKPEQDLSHTTRPIAPIIKDWVSDFKEEFKTKATQFVPSFAQSSKHVKSPRHSDQPIETTIPAATPIPASPKTHSSGKRRNRKACFICKSQYSPLTHFKPQKHMVPTAVLTQSKPVFNTTVRPVSAALPNITVTRPRYAHHVVTKSKSPIRRHITRSPSSKTSTSPSRVIVVKALVVSAAQGKQRTWGNSQQVLKDKGVIDSGCLRNMIGNMSYLSKFEELNRGYVTFGGNHKGGKITGKGKIKTGTGPTWLFDIDSLTRTMNYQPVTVGNQTNSGAEFEDCSANSSNEVNAVGSIVLTVGQNSLNSTNTFNMPELEDITYSNDEDVGGAKADFNNLESSIPVSPIPTTRIHKDHPVSQIIGDLSSTTQTRSITRADKDQNGLSQMFDNEFYTCMFASFLSKEEPKRVHQALKDPSWIEAMQEELLQFKMQKSAFLYETIEEEVYVCQPPRFEDPNHPDKAYKVVKALYGLHQAPRAWYETLASFILENGFQRGTIDQTLFIKKQKGDILLVQIYVDDIIFEKPLLKDPDGEDVDVYTYRLVQKQMALGKDSSNLLMADNLPKITNNVTRLQALVDKKKVVITESTIRDALRLDDAEGVDCWPNEEIFAELACMGYEKPSTKLTFYKAFFSSQWKFLIHTILQSMSAKHTSWNEFSSAIASAVIFLTTGDLLTYKTKYTSPALTQKVFANIKRVGKGCSGAETPLFEGMLVVGVIEEEGDTEEQVQDVVEVNAAQGDDFAIIRDVVQDQSIPSPTPPTPPPQQPQDLPSTSQKKKAEEAKVAGDDQVQERQAKIYQIYMDHALKVLTIQEDEPAKVQEVLDVVTTAKLIIKVVTAVIRVATASTKRRKRVVIKDPKDESTTIIPADTKSKDKGKGIMVEEPKPLKKKQQVKIDEEYARKLHEELNKDIDWSVVNDHVKQKANEDPFVQRYQGLSYDDTRLIFEAKFNSNNAFLLKIKEQLEEEENKAIQSINETPAQKSAKRKKLNEKVEDLKRHLEIVPDEDDDVYTEATPLARKVPVVDYEIIHLNNKPHYKIIQADGTYQVYVSFLTLLKNFDRENLESLWSLVNEIFSTSKPDNFSDDFLLTTL